MSSICIAIKISIDHSKRDTSLQEYVRVISITDSDSAWNSTICQYFRRPGHIFFKGQILKKSVWYVWLLRWVLIILREIYLFRNMSGQFQLQILIQHEILHSMNISRRPGHIFFKGQILKKSVWYVWLLRWVLIILREIYLFKNMSG